MVKPQQLQRLEDGKSWSMATTDRRPICLCTVAGEQVRSSLRLLLL